MDKVQSGQFVEMTELLADNISLVHQLESIQGFSPLNLLGATRPRLREITSLSTWIYCFLGYVAIRTSDPTARDQLAYARLIVREALRHGGACWLDYDRAFRQQAAADRWNTILPGLQASTMLGHGSSQGAQFCTLCREVDHTRANCAFLCLQSPTQHTTAASTRPGADTGFYEGGFFYLSVRRPRPLLLATPTFNHIQFLKLLFFLNSTIDNREGGGIGNAVLLYWRMLDTLRARKNVRVLNTRTFFSVQYGYWYSPFSYLLFLTESDPTQDSCGEQEK